MKVGIDRQFGKLAAVLLTALLWQSATAPAPSQVLRGGVQEENLRLQPTNRAGAPLQGRTGDSMRISRTPLQGSAVDAGAFAALKAANAPLGAGVVDNNDFAKAPKNFDIGAERGSKEMVLAWEKWHKQLSGAIYSRWQQLAEDRGKATIRVIVTNDRQIRAQVLSLDGGPAFEREIMQAIGSLNGNPGLTFPAKSVRQKVSFDADYIADTDVRPGYSWVKNDYEKVKENY